MICKIKFIKYFVERERGPRSLWGNLAEVVAEDGEGPCVALVGSGCLELGRIAPI